MPEGQAHTSLKKKTHKKNSRVNTRTCTPSESRQSLIKYYKVRDEFHSTRCTLCPEPLKSQATSPMTGMLAHFQQIKRDEKVSSTARGVCSPGWMRR